MKRVLCLIIALATMLSNAAFAAVDLSVLAEQRTSAECSFEASFTLNKPLNFIEKLSEFDENPITGVLDLDVFIESLFKSAVKGTLKMNASKDLKKMDLAIETESTAPAQFNRNLAVTVNAKAGIWINLDLSDAENPIYGMILRTPTADKYITVDMAKLLKSDPTSEAQLEKTIKACNLLANEFAADGINNAALKLIEECATIGRAGNTITVKFDDEGFKKYISELFEMTKEFSDVFSGLSDLSELPEVSNDMVTSELPEVSEDTDMSELAEAAEDEFVPEMSEDMPASVIGFGFDADTIAEALKNIRILGKDGIELRYTISGRTITKADTKAHISVNVGEVVRAFGADEEYASAFDNANVDFTFKSTESYRNVNKGVNVTKPVLNAENSISLNELMQSNETIPEDWEYYDDYEYDYFSVFTNDFISLGINNAYVGVRDLFESTYEDFEITYSDGTVTAVSANDRFGFDKAVFRVGAKTVNVDGAELALENPVIMRNGKVYVDGSFVLAVFNFDTDQISFYPMTDELVMGFTKRAW